MVMHPQTIEAIYRMSHEQRLSVRQISVQLHVSRQAVRKYLDCPLPKPIVRKPRNSKLDPFKPVIRELLEQCPRASSVVIAQRIRLLGYTGGRSILREYIGIVRRTLKPPRAYVRVESSPGDCFQIEWGNILYNTTIAAAIADRLVENSEVFLLGGPTCRNPKNGQTSAKE